MTCIAMEEYELMKDSKYRMYVQAVDKALKNFEYTSEWADLCAALGKLNKVLSNYAKYPVIPKRIKISKRLAQCMHPALPSGVHLKALDTYDTIFKCMGTNRLSQELFIYSAGLFPLLGHAAMNIRPTLLTVYETHFVPLRERLRPALSGFLSGVLPGLETGSDHFDRTNALLENVCDGVGVTWFYTNIWQCVCSNSPVRLPAISFVLAHYSRKVSMEDQLYLMGNYIDVMVSGLCAAVQDSSVLVQRAALDLLVACFPMQNTQLLYADMVRLVTAALSTILRRDMSLNRRLYSWLLSTEVQSSQNPDDDESVKMAETSNSIISYDYLTEAIRFILKQASAEICINVKPYRLLMSLFDKPQIGPTILDGILYDVFRALYLSCLNQQKHKQNGVRCVSFNGNLASLKTNENVLTKEFLTVNCQDLIKNANLLFNTLQSYYIWSYIERLFETAVNFDSSKETSAHVNDIGFGPPNSLEICILTDFLLDIIPIETYIENTMEILPNLFKKIVSILIDNIDSLNKLEVMHSLQLCMKVLLKIQPIVKNVSIVDLSGDKDIQDLSSLIEENQTDDTSLIDSETIELKIGLEKSKSDSKLNEKINKNELTIDSACRERSNSNQMLKKTKNSPKIDKKKNKKSRSSSKLYELKKEELEELEENEITPKKRKSIDITEFQSKTIENKHIIDCFNLYKKFYVKLIQNKIIPEIDIELFFQSLIIKIDKTETLENLLENCLQKNCDKKRNFCDIPALKSCIKDAKLSDFEKTMQIASKLLLEFSSFPNILNAEPPNLEVPFWLKAIIVSACFPKATNEVQIIAMNTLMDIFSLIKSQKHSKNAQNCNNIVIMGILDEIHVTFIEESTIILEVICQILWDFIGTLCNQNLIILCVTLLYNIHNIFESTNYAEKIIGKHLTTANLSPDAFKRFYLIWHLGRELNIQFSSNQGIKNFDRSLLKILDNLQNQEICNIRLLCETFLTQSLLRNDVSRIINPILQKLLLPSTARISIRYVNIQDVDNAENLIQDFETIESKKKIYAISDVNGSVMFHMTDFLSPKMKKKWGFFSKSGKKYSQIINFSDNLSKKSKDFTKIGEKSNVFVNPLDSKEIYPFGINGNYSKINHSSSESLNFDTNFDSIENCATITNIPQSPTFEAILGDFDANCEKNAQKITKSKSFDDKSAIECVENEPKMATMASNSEPEISVVAEDFFADDAKIVREILNEIIDAICIPEEPQKSQKNKKMTLYPMHFHICLYYEIFDANHVLYALKTLKNCINSNPQLFIKCLSTSGFKNLQNNELLFLLARHRKSILGGGFSGEISAEMSNFYKNHTFLDILITIALNFARSFYPNLDDLKLTNAEIDNNLQIQLASFEILEIITKNLTKIVNDSKEFSGYVAETLLKNKLQKILLHCLLTSVKHFDDDLTFADEVLMFNNFKLYDANKRVSQHVEAYQIQLLRLIHSVIILEYQVFGDKETIKNLQQSNNKTSEQLSYVPTILIPEQDMFISAILSALKHQNMKNLHQNWLNMVTSCLPYFGENLSQIILSVSNQICNNLEKVADFYNSAEIGGEISADYAIIQLEALQILVHYCLLEPENAHFPNSRIFINLVNAFFPPIFTNLSNENYQKARKAILGNLPRIVISVAKLWQTIVNIDGNFEGIFGQSKIIKQQLLDFLSPIYIHHSSNFLGAIAVAWYERRNPFTNVKTVQPEPNSSQKNLVFLLSTIRMIPLENLVQTVIAVIKNPPQFEGLCSDIYLDVCLLEVFYCYMCNTSSTQLYEAWSSILSLVREGCFLAPPAQFLLAALLHELMIKCCPIEEKKDLKDLQDITTKLIESVSQICGSCLQQTTWLRRNLAVKEQDEDSISSVSVVSGNNSDILTGINNSYSVQAQLVLSEILAQILDICFGSADKDKVIAILTSLMCNIVPYLRTHSVRNMPSFNACSKLLASLSSYQYTRKAWKKDVFDLLLDNTLFQMDYSCLKYWKTIVDNLMTHDNTTFRDLMSRVSMTQTGTLNIFSSREQEYEQRGQLLKRLAFVIFCSETDQYAKYMPDIQEQLTSSLRLNVPGVQAQVFMCFRVLLIRMSPLHVTSLWPIIISEMLQVFLQIEQELSLDTEEYSSHVKLLAGLESNWAPYNGLYPIGHPHWIRLQLAAAKLLDLSLLLPATSLPQFQMYRWAFVGDELITSATSFYNPLDVHSSSFTPHICRIASLMDQRFLDVQIQPILTQKNELLITTNNISQLKDLYGFFKTLSINSNRHRTECNGIISNDYIIHVKNIDKKINSILEKLDKIVEMDFLDKISR